MAGAAGHRPCGGVHHGAALALLDVHRCRLYLSGPKEAAALSMKNGLYSVHIHMLDGVRGRDSGVLILRNGVIIGPISGRQAPTPSVTGPGRVN
jgi:hypothetical protein